MHGERPGGPGANRDVTVDTTTRERREGAGPGSPLVPIVRLSGVRRAYRGVVAVERVDLAIQRGEFFTLLGPSGSGKTTTLRLIAGFEKPDQGHIEIDGVEVTARPPFDRDINTVFQDYALFPHMSVANNIAYGLRAKRLPKDEIGARVAEVLRMVRLQALGGRMPAQLSGGQRQRVALARAIVNRPTVLLLDEPLGALDLKLRQEMQTELKRIQEEVRITFIYVTHDQEEALTMSDRLAVFNHGRIVQIGTPTEVYERPVNEFVAGFVGTSNLLERKGRRLIIRPERVRLVPAGEKLADPGLEIEPGVIKEAVYVGMFTRFFVALEDGTELVAVQQNLGPRATARLAVGERVRVAWPSDGVAELPPGDPVKEETESGTKE
jgi:putative spermidine/putrescine transport system ATP-binding protein